MATLKYYFPSTGAAAVSPAYSASWTGNPSARLAAVTAKINSADALVSGTVSWGTAPYVEKKEGVKQYVTPAVGVAYTWTTGDTIKCQIQQTRENITGKPYWVIRVCDAAGTSFKGTLYEGDADTEDQVGRRNQALGAGGAAKNVQNSFAMEATDLIVIEFGYRATASTDWQSQYYYTGDLDASTDLPENETDTGNDHVPWIQFTYNPNMPISSAGAIATAEAHGTGKMRGTIQSEV